MQAEIKNALILYRKSGARKANDTSSSTRKMAQLSRSSDARFSLERGSHLEGDRAQLEHPLYVAAACDDPAPHLRVGKSCVL